MTCQQMNRLTGAFQSALSKALSSDNQDDWIVHLKTISNVFTQASALVASEESAKNIAIAERDQALEELTEFRAKAAAHDDVIQQLHFLLNAKNVDCNNDVSSLPILQEVKKQVDANMDEIADYRLLEAKYNVEKRRSERMAMHINEVSKKSVMHLMATRFYARELAAMRQLMDLVRNASTIESAVKSKLWDEIEKENRLLRLNTLWLINSINSPDLRDAPFENGDDWQSQPRLVILMREHINQGLGLEITGGCDEFRPVVVTGKLKRSMADDDQLLLDDRILAIDGTFVTNTTTHAEVMEMLENESAKDFISLIVSQFNPTKYQLANPNFYKISHYKNVSSSASTSGTSHSGVEATEETEDLK